MKKNREEDAFLVKLGTKIAEKRKELKLTQEDLAEKSDLTRMQIYRIEIGESPTTIIVLRRIAKALQMKLNILLDID